MRRLENIGPGRAGLGRMLGVLAAVILSASCATGPVGTPPSPPAQPATFREAVGVQSLPSTIPKFYDNGPKIERKMLELIEAATDYILIDSYLVVADPSTMPVLEALKRKQRSGVRIYVLADSSSRFMRPGVAGYKYLREAGIACVEYNPIRSYKLIVAPVMLPRDHRKFWIVDGEVLFLGGANILATSLDPPENGGNHDFMVAVESARAIEQMVASFVKAWNRSSPRKLHKRNFPVRSSRAGEIELWLFDQNQLVRQQGVISDMVAGLFSVAKKEVWLIQPYTFVNSKLLGQIETLSRRGVQVNLMLSSDVHSPRFHYASYYGIKDVLEAGGKVWVYSKPGGSFLHAKAVIVDGCCASVGSANLNLRSYRLSKETNLVFADAQSVGEIKKLLEELKRDCRLIGMEEAESYRTGNYYIAWRMMQWAG